MLTERQLDRRRRGIGASECAVAAGLHPFLDRWRLFNSKVFGVVSDETAAMRAGTFLEDGVARMYAADFGVQLYKGAGTRVHPAHEWMLATPDRYVPNGSKRRPEYLVEIKVPGARGSGWGFDQDAVPSYVLAQCQWQLEVLSVDRVDVAAFFLHSRELAVYRIERNQKLIDALVALNEKFWVEHILPKVPPPVDDTDACKDGLAKIFASPSEAMVPAPPEAEAFARTYAFASADAKSAEARKQAAGNQLRAIIGNAAGVTGPWGSCTHRLEARGRPEWKAIAQEYRNQLELRGVVRAELDETVSRYTSAPIRKIRCDYKDAL